MHFTFCTKGQRINELTFVADKNNIIESIIMQ